MKLRRLFCLLLAFVCIFSVVFSVSVSAYEVNGYSVDTSYGLGDSNLGPIPFTDFTTTISSSSTADIITVKSKIVFPEPIKENAIFDLNIGFDYGSASSIDAIYTLRDANNNNLGSGEKSVENKQLILKDLVADGGDLTHIDFVFTINSPTWNENIVETPSTNITDLTGYTVTVPAGWLATAGYGEFNIDGSFTNGSYTDRPFSNLRVGYRYTSGTIDKNNLVFTPTDNKISIQLKSESFLGSGNTSELIFMFTGGKDSDDSDFIQWLYDNNATFEKIGGDEEETTSYVGTWVLNPSVSYDGTSTVKFDDIVGKFYGKKNSSSSSLVEYDIARIELSPTGNIFTVKNMYNLSSGFCHTYYSSNTWKSAYFASTSSSTSTTSLVDTIRTLVITEEPNNETFKNWLSSNATKQSTYALARSSVEYTYNFTITSISNDVTQSGEEYSGIIGWIKNVFNSITGLPARIANSISSFFTALGDKITDLGTTILNGIKSLFIPTEEDITAFKDNMESLLYDRLGGVGEAGQIVAEFADNFMSYDGSVTGETTLPSVTVNLAGTDFTFGGFTVDFVPDGFEGLIESIKLITNISATFLLVNALKKRFEEVLT